MTIAGIIVDVIIIAFIAGNAFWGYKKGLINYIFDICAVIVTIVLVALLYKPVGNLVMEKTQFDENLQSGISTNLTSLGLTDSAGIKVEDSNLSESVVNVINNYIHDAVNKAVDNVADYVAAELSKLIIYALTMIALFIVIRLILIVLKLIVNMVGDMPILNTINGAGGLVYGLLKGLLLLYLIFAILSALSPVISQTGIVGMIEESFVGKFVYNNNFLVKLVIK